jgi:uncharacterized protein YqgC (DUF456 family)
MDSMLVIIGFCCMLIGVIGSPVVPGAPMSWIGLAPSILQLWFQQTIGLSIIGNHYHFIRIYYPVQRNKTIRRKFLWHLGNNIGLVAGLLSPIPFGFLIGAFTGALIGELLHDSKITNALESCRVFYWF